MMERFSIARMTVEVYRAPIAVPVETSFGRMPDRPVVLIRLEDADGAHGWGEIWCNFPSVGAEHRARLAQALLPPLVFGKPVTDPAAFTRALESALRILVLQTGEVGPVAQILAGFDIALWDLCARRAGRPLRALLAATPRARVPAYASGIHCDAAATLIEDARAQGFDAFKIKIGFGPDKDTSMAARLPDLVGAGETLMLDANQKWTLREATDAARRFEPLSPAWLEEPMPVDRPDGEWSALAEATAIPLAGGENMAGRAAFERAIGLGALGVIQPDACKWGGISGCFDVAKAALAAGRGYCPHFLGGGIGLVASAHLLAAAGGSGRLEVDVNPNPLREALARPFPAIQQGHLALSDAAGLGVEPDPRAARWRVLTLSA